MLTKHRKQQLLALLAKDGQVIAKDVSATLGLSEDTIRRDLRELSREGLLQRVHGGALPVSPALADLAGRSSIAAEGKSAIGRAAAAMIRAGQVVLLDGGTTAREVARHLPLDLDCTIATHSPTIAAALVDHRRAEVILIGGRLFKHSMVSVGAAAIEAIGRIHADTCFMGVTGVHPEAGLTTGDFEEAAVKRALCRAAAETIVLASSEKLNTASAYRVVALRDIAAILTEKSAGEALVKPYRKMGIAVTRV